MTSPQRTCFDEDMRFVLAGGSFNVIDGLDFLFFQIPDQTRDKE